MGCSFAECSLRLLWESATEWISFSWYACEWTVHSVVYSKRTNNDSIKRDSSTDQYFLKQRWQSIFEVIRTFRPFSAVTYRKWIMIEQHSHTIELITATAKWENTSVKTITKFAQIYDSFPVRHWREGTKYSARQCSFSCSILFFAGIWSCMQLK